MYTSHEEEHDGVAIGERVGRNYVRVDNVTLLGRTIPVCEERVEEEAGERDAKRQRVDHDSEEEIGDETLRKRGAESKTRREVRAMRQSNGLPVQPQSANQSLRRAFECGSYRANAEDEVEEKTTKRCVLADVYEAMKALAATLADNDLERLAYPLYEVRSRKAT